MDRSESNHNLLTEQLVLLGELVSDDGAGCPRVKERDGLRDGSSGPELHGHRLDHHQDPVTFEAMLPQSLLAMVQLWYPLVDFLLAKGVVHLGVSVLHEVDLDERLFNVMLKPRHTRGPSSTEISSVLSSRTLVANSMLTDVTYMSLASCSEVWCCLWERFMLHTLLGFVAFFYASAVCLG